MRRLKRNWFEIRELRYLITVDIYPDFHLTMHTYTCALKAGRLSCENVSV